MFNNKVRRLVGGGGSVEKIQFHTQNENRKRCMTCNLGGL